MMLTIYVSGKQWIGKQTKRRRVQEDSEEEVVAEERRRSKDKRVESRPGNGLSTVINNDYAK